MPKPRPLVNAEAAKGTLAHRLTRHADRLRQFNTRFGVRSQRVFLVWTRWTGERRGEGRERVIHRVELLPTPRVNGRLTRRPYLQGVVQEGSVLVDQISCGAYTSDQLRGVVIPGSSPELMAPRGTVGAPVAGERYAPRDDPRVDFYYVIQGDGRGDDPGDVERYRVLGKPERKEGSLYFSVLLEKAEEDPDRFGDPGSDDDDVWVV